MDLLKNLTAATMMGSLTVTMSGVYCFSVMLGRLLSTVLQGVSLPLDPTILVSSVLATDMGAYSIADTLCTDYTQKIFSGVLLSATLGTTISFSLPIALGSIPSKDSKNLMTGMVYGIIAIPVVLIIGSLLSGMALTALLKSLLPVLLICALLGLCIFYGGEKAIRVFQLRWKRHQPVGDLFVRPDCPSGFSCIRPLYPR